MLVQYEIKNRFADDVMLNQLQLDPETVPLRQLIFCHHVSCSIKLTVSNITLTGFSTTEKDMININVKSIVSLGQCLM